MTKSEWEASFNEADKAYYKAYQNAFKISREIIQIVARLRDDTSLTKESRNELCNELGVACSNYEFWNNRVGDTDRRKLEACYSYGLGGRQTLSELLNWAYEFGELKESNGEK